MHGKHGNAPSGADPSQRAQTEAVEEGMTGGDAAKAAGIAADAAEIAADKATAAPESGSGAATGEDPAAKLASAQAEIAELNDRYLRKVADLENYRKRMAREMEDARLYANTELLLDLVSLLDDFDRAIQSSETGKDWKSLHDGVGMIQKAFLGKLETRYGLKRFESAGQPFDPSRHEALMAEKRGDIEAPVVLEDFFKGYSLHERVIRPAKVKVAMPVAGGASADVGASAGQAGTGAPDAGAATAE